MNISRQHYYSTDWFSGNIPNWTRLFEAYGLNAPNKKNKCLEIGSWEGRSAVFTIETLLLQNVLSSITCIDTFMGSEEHSKDDNSALYNLFMYNVKLTQKFDQVRVIKEKSEYAIPSIIKENKDELQSYDFIYVDGSHRSDDVLMDALNCFKLLKIGGLMIFDDYKWTAFEDEYHNPKKGIDVFLIFMRPYINIVMEGYQLAIVKTKEV
jgi:hypothetical protein